VNIESTSPDCSGSCDIVSVIDSYSRWR